MKIKLTSKEITGLTTGALIIGIGEKTKQLSGTPAIIDAALDNAISKMIKSGEIKGKLHEFTSLYNFEKIGAQRVIVAGLGELAKMTTDRIRGVTAEACRKLRSSWVNNIAITLPDVASGKINPESTVQAIAEGALLGNYSFRQHMTSKAELRDIKDFVIVVPPRSKIRLLRAAMKRGEIIAQAAVTARDMVNEPGNFMTPSHMAAKAEEISRENKLKITVFNRDKMKEMGMGGLLGVAQGSAQPPKFIVLEYYGTESKTIQLALVGKGITFDSGGISIKPSAKMEEMKGDMAGGASVMAAIAAISQLKLKLNVAAIVPATENLPSGEALKPGDVLTTMSGKTIEIISTDAEGRLALADALSYAKKMGAKQIIDVATLTGACAIALGTITSGAFGNNQPLMKKMLKAADESGELTWQMPMFEQYREMIMSSVADIKNVGDRYGGAITAALFLAEFTGNTPWVHLDIAGPFISAKDTNYLSKGATGIPVRTLVTLAINMAQE